MSVTVEASSISYDGNDIADEFAVPFKFLETNDLLVRTTDDNGDTYTTLVEGVDYTVDGEGEDAGGAVTTTDPVATGTSIVIERNTDITQETDFAPQGPFPAARHETALDKLTLICQELNRRIEALEALGDLVTVSELADAVEYTASFHVDGDEPEAIFPIQLVVAGGENAKYIIWHVWKDGAESTKTDEPPQVQWFPGPADRVTVVYISGLEPQSTLYQLRALVFF